MAYSKSTDVLRAWMGTGSILFVSCTDSCTFFILSERTVFMEMAITQADIDAVRAYRNEQQRAWWAKQSEEERRERRLRYHLNAIRRKQEDQNKKYEVKSHMRGKQ